MKKLLQTGDLAPSFLTRDIHGNIVSTFQNDKWVFISFHRFAACPFCALRAHELIKNHQKFMEMNIDIISIWPSSKRNMLKYVGSNTSPFPLIADSEKDIYIKYKVTKSSIWGTVSTMLHFKILISALKYKYNDINIDANPNLLPAEFLINTNREIVLAHYGSHFGDHVDIDHLLALASK